MKEIIDYKPPALSKDCHPLISVCVAVYNSEDFLPRSIESVLNQTYERLEIILVDDGSTDSSGDICDEYRARDDRIKVIHKKNGGLYTTRNTGIEQAGGEYICFLDGDDYIDPDMYESMIDALISSGADLCSVRYRCIYEDGQIKDGSRDKAFLFNGTEMLEQYLKEDEAILIQNCAWNKLYRRELIGDLRFPARWYEDMLYTPRLLSKIKKGIYLDHAYHNYICDRSSSIMNMGINKRIFTDLIPNLYDRSAFLENIGEHDIALLSDYMLYRKLMRIVDEVSESSYPDKNRDLKTLGDLINAGRDRFDEIFGIPFASDKEYKKLKVYLRSPAAYHMMIAFNKRVRVPLKQRLLSIG